jgi:hypothetical protein
MSDDPIIQKIINGTMSRVQRLATYENAKRSLRLGKDIERAKQIMHVIDTVSVPPLQAEYVFMGFCPGASLENRQDELWYADGICEFDWVSDPIQMRRFYDIQVGDTIIAKKRERFGETMMISGHGKVIKREESNRTGKRYFRVDWRVPKEFLIVPLIGCNSTVNTRTLKFVEETMPVVFWDWLREGVEVSH